MRPTDRGGVRGASALTRVAGLVLAVALLAAPRHSAAGETTGDRYSRPVEVETAGWIRVPVELDMRRHVAPDGRGLALLSPRGDPMPFALVPGSEEGRRVSARVVSVEASDPDGWWIRIDAGGEVERHRALVFDFSAHTLVAGVRLDALGPEGDWRQLAESDLFRLGDVATSKLTHLEYAATTARHLRLWWPAAAGFPEVREVELETAAVSPRAAAELRPSCSESGRATTCRLNIAPLGAERLVVDLRSPADHRGLEAGAFRLSAAEDGHWRELQAGAWSATLEPPPARVLRLPAGSHASTYRLELFAADTAPVLTACRVEYAPLALLFEAGELGTYTLAYGGSEVGRRMAPAPPAERAGAATVAAGPLGRRIPPVLPQRLTAPSQPLPDHAFPWQWEVQEFDSGSGARSQSRADAESEGAPGGVVHLEIPPAVYATTRGDLSRLRLAVGSRQLPYVLWQPDEPTPAFAAFEARPESVVERGRALSRVALPSDLGAFSAVDLELSSQEGPFGRQLRFVSAKGAESTDQQERTTGWVAWTCPEGPPFPCRQSLSLLPRGRTDWKLEIDDGENPPLDSATVAAWRRRDVLVFVWPPAERESGTVRLLAANSALSPAGYDLELRREELLHLPYRDVPLDLEAAKKDARAADHLGRVVLLGTLALAGVLLVLLVARLVGEERRGEPPTGS